MLEPAALKRVLKILRAAKEKAVDFGIESENRIASWNSPVP